MKKIIGVLICFSILPFILSAQTEEELEYQKEYEQRILLSHINDIYIPKDVEDAFIELNRLSDSTSVKRFKLGDEQTVSRKLHFGLGKWMIVNWGFYDGSRLSHHLKGLGIHHPDDMANFLIVGFHRHLNSKPQEYKLRIEAYQESRKQMLEERITARDTL
jgi:hypothetical protein